MNSFGLFIYLILSKNIFILLFNFYSSRVFLLAYNSGLETISFQHFDKIISLFLTSTDAAEKSV